MASEFGFHRLTERQRDVLGAIAVNQDEGHHRQTLRALERKGLITQRKERLPGSHFAVVITRWDMPTRVHMAWCAWCSEQEPD